MLKKYESSLCWRAHSATSKWINELYLECQWPTEAPEVFSKGNKEKLTFKWVKNSLKIAIFIVEGKGTLSRLQMEGNFQDRILYQTKLSLIRNTISDIKGLENVFIIESGHESLLLCIAFYFSFQFCQFCLICLGILMLGAYILKMIVSVWHIDPFIII